MAGSFTAHNIRLDDGSFTKPEQPYQMEDLALLKFTKHFCGYFFPRAPRGNGLSILDASRVGMPSNWRALASMRWASRFGKAISKIVSESKRGPICPI